MELTIVQTIIVALVVAQIIMIVMEKYTFCNHETNEKHRTMAIIHFNHIRQMSIRIVAIPIVATLMIQIPTQTPIPIPIHNFFMDTEIYKRRKHDKLHRSPAKRNSRIKMVFY